MRPIRSATVLASLMLATAVAAPGVAAFEETEDSGTTGFYTIPDYDGQPGVKCKYENNQGKKNDEIDVVKIGDHWTHGPFEMKSWVGSRFLIQKDGKPFGDGWKRIHTSKVIKKRANDAEIADFGARTWRAPENKKARYRVIQVLFFYAKGSKTTKIGKVKGIYEVYRHRMNPKTPFDVGNEGGPSGFCLHNYHAIVP